MEEKDPKLQTNNVPAPSINLPNMPEISSECPKFGEKPVPTEPVNDHEPLCCIVIGMAGSGKSTLMQRLIKHSELNKCREYVVNLDPAVTNLNYPINIDIRDTVDYKGVMKNYELGPNGSIMTSLNLFSTKFDQVLNLIDKKKDNLDYIFIDTPGQIEVFTWSASGAIISESLANSYPTIVLYVVDTPRTIKPTTFMSNMLYACSILYKTMLPMIVVFNKVDIQSHEFAVDWMTDFESFQEAIQMEKESSFSLSLTQSMGLTLDEFYKNLNCVGVSSYTGEGMNDLFNAMKLSKLEYYNGYKKDLLNRIKIKEQEKIRLYNENMGKLSRDFKDVDLSTNNNTDDHKHNDQIDSNNSNKKDDDGDNDDDEVVDTAEFDAWLESMRKQ